MHHMEKPEQSVSRESITFPPDRPLKRTIQVKPGQVANTKAALPGTV